MASPATTGAPRDNRTHWHRFALQFGSGGVAGLAVFLCSHQYLASFGVSLAVTAALTTAVGLACGIGLMLRSTAGRLPWGRWIQPAAWLTVAVWTVAFTWLLAFGRSLVSLVPLAWLTSEATSFCAMLSIAGLLFVPPVAAGLLLTRAARPSNGARPSREASISGL